MAKVSLRAYNREIEAMIDRGQLDEAIAHCRHILLTYPKHLETYRLLGKAYLESKRFGDAEDIFSRILVTVPNDFVAHVGMSIIRDEENNLDEAIWHMERAFETQPSNPAIQAELQRLYARRDGVRPPRIRMTRGALANMYVQGELYPQAISEIKNVLKDDPERADMQALLARASYKSGLKNEAADVASALLRRYPYSLDANRVLVEILGLERPENVQAYRQRVFELDPYAALVTGSIFLSNEVSDAAVNVERLDWGGQPVAMQPDWGAARAISLASGAREEEPDWLSKPPDETSFFGTSPAVPESIFGSAPPPEKPPAFEEIQSAPATIFGSVPPPEQPAVKPEDEIPEFMSAAGWGKSTGLFDESKSVFGEEEPNPAEPIEQGELPDWVKAMKPPETIMPPQQEEEEIPDWIKSIGAGVIASQAGDHTDWLDQTGPSTEAQIGGETTEWLPTLEGESAVTPAGEQASDLDWLNELGASDVVPSTSEAEQPDWLRSLGGVKAAPPAEASTDELDWLKDLGEPEAVSSAQGEEQPDWLKTLSESEPAPMEAQADELDWLKTMGETKAAAEPVQTEESDWLKGMGKPESLPLHDQEDQPDWLKGAALVGGLAAMSQLAREDEPEGTVEKPAVPGAPESEMDFLSAAPEEPILDIPPTSIPPAMDLDRLGVTEQEQEDSFAWLESLAAKQGASEGLLTQPEERLEEEPDWVKQAKGLKTEEPVSQPPMEQQPVSLEDLGMSEQEQEDSFAWLEGLAAKQGASEGLLTQPEERLEEEPAWVKQARDLSVQEMPPAVAPEPQMEEPAALDEPVAETGQPSSVEEVETWLENLAGEETTTEHVAAADETAIWLRGLEEKEVAPAEPAEAGQPEIPDWMKDIQVGPEEESASIFAEEAEFGSTWMPPVEEPTPAADISAEEDALPSWLSELEKEEEEEQIATPPGEDELPSWLLAEEMAPASTEPTIFSDWRPAEEVREGPISEPPPAPEESEPILVAPTAVEMPRAETIAEIEQPPAEPEPALEPQPSSAEEVAPVIDPVLGTARDELSHNNVPGALQSYGKLIKKARYLDEVIYDLREALYQHPVDVNIWQSLGDAYMRANRLQDALDAYTKAEELLR